jgi:hypothetical protein
MQSVPGNTILHLPCDPADLCSDQRSLHNPMEFEMHALLVPACPSAPLQGSLVHHKYSTCNFRILHYGYFCYCIQCTQRSVRRQRINDPVVYKIGYHHENKALMNLPGVASAKKLTHMDKISKVPGNFTGGNKK